jgi:hypothetical protein
MCQKQRGTPQHSIDLSFSRNSSDSRQESLARLGSREKLLKTRRVLQSSGEINALFKNPAPHTARRQIVDQRSAPTSFEGAREQQHTGSQR